jgi:hypothetical protein
MLHTRVVSAISLALLGFVAAAWSLTTLPSFQAIGPVREIASHILANHAFKPSASVDVLTRIGSSPYLKVLQSGFSRSEAIIYLRWAEEATLHGQSDEQDRETVAAERKVQCSLSLNPMDGFLWLMLYSVKNIRNGFDRSHLPFLEQSYATTPWEGWVALRRSRLALSVFPMISEAVQNTGVREFAALVDSGFLDDAVVILTGVGWIQRQRLLDGLTQADIVARERLARRLAQGGVKVEVPGVEVDQRWWR